MEIQVSVEPVKPRPLAAVRRCVLRGAVSLPWRPALDLVWAFLRARPGLHAGGHNVFLYTHPSRPCDPVIADFGVEVAQSFTPAGEIFDTATPAGEAAVAVHRGTYDGILLAHAAIQRWAVQNGRTFAGRSWEIYGDWNEDPSRLETAVFYLLDS